MMKPIFTSPEHERPIYGNARPGETPATADVTAHFHNDTLVVASQFRSGELIEIVGRMGIEVQVHGGVGLGNYFSQVAKLSPGQKHTVDLVDHSNIENGVLCLSDVDISKAGLLKERHARTQLLKAIEVGAIGKIRLLGCYTGVDAGAANVQSLATYLGIAIEGTKCALRRDDFDTTGLRDEVDVIAREGDARVVRPPADGDVVAPPAPGDLRLLLHPWSAVKNHPVPLSVASRLLSLLEHPRRSEHEFEKPIATIIFVDDDSPGLLGHHVEILGGFRAVRYYVTQNGTASEHTASVHHAPALREFIEGTGSPITTGDVVRHALNMKAVAAVNS